MISTTLKNNFKKIGILLLKIIAAAAFWIIIWEAASRYVSRDNEMMLLFLPSPKTVFLKWQETAYTPEYLQAVWQTTVRVFAGFFIGVLFGFLMGVLTHISVIFDTLFSPFMKTVRAVPVIAISILLFLLFESDMLPIIIVTLLVAPIVWQTVYDGLNNPKKELIEMTRAFRINKLKTFFYVKMPSIVPSLLTAIASSLGLAWKSGIAAEVICMPDVSLGTVMWRSKEAIDFSQVYVVTITVIILSIIIEFLVKALVSVFLNRGGDDK